MNSENIMEGGRHHRIDERLREYWDELRKGRKFPHEDEVDPKVLEDIWDACFLIHADDDSETQKAFKYTYLGLSLIEAYGDDWTGQDVCNQLVAPESKLLLDEFHEVVSTGAPATADGNFTNHKNMLVKYRTIMLPLGRSEEKVDYILGGMKWKAY